MIVPHLLGGMCNQMFQIAAAYSAAKRNGTDFAINYNIATCALQGKHPINYKDTFYKNLPVTTNVPSKTYNAPDWAYSQIP